mmetsp:Transcript_25003/g.75060  ORF Transcript_25003/g.75060 Transcript_25003/m.75060 type:complete len:238 (+) Transcript_25003:170-883(+)
MYGSGMFQAMQRAKANTAKKAQTAEEKLEASRKAREAEAAAGREKILAQKAMRERVAAAEKQALAEEAELQAREKAALEKRREAERAALAAHEELVRKRDLRVASQWYYVDEHDARQGPFEPATMRGWFSEGHLPRDLRVAPFFEGDAQPPAVAVMQAIEDIFDEPLLTSAFRSRAKPRVTAPPPEEKPKEKRKREEEPEATGDWLKDSLARQKKGIHRLRHDRHDGPAMLFDSHEA